MEGPLLSPKQYCREQFTSHPLYLELTACVQEASVCWKKAPSAQAAVSRALLALQAASHVAHPRGSTTPGLPTGEPGG